MADFDAGSIGATLTLDRTPFEEGVKQARTTGKKLAGEKFSVKLDADTSKATRKVDELNQRVARLSGATIAIEANTAKASSALTGLQKKVDRLSGGSIDVDADTSAAAKHLKVLTAQLDRLTSSPHKITLDVDSARAQNQLNAVGAQLSRLTGARATIEVDADTAAATAGMTSAGAQAAKLDGFGATVRITAEDAQFKATFGAASAELRAFALNVARAKLDADIAGLNSKIQDAQAKLQALANRSTDPKITLDIADLDLKRDEVLAKLDDLSQKKSTPQVAAQVEKAQIDLARIDLKLTELNSKRANPQVTADTAAAMANLRLLQAQMDTLALKRANLRVDADTNPAKRGLDDVKSSADRLDGRRVSTSVDMAGGDRAHLILMAIVAGLGAVGAAAPAAAAALAAIPAAVGIAGQALGAITLGFNGIGDAVKASEAQEKSAASTSQTAAKQRTAAARQIANAAIGVAQAEEQAARTAITSAQQVGDAQAQLSQARQAQARTAVQGAAQIAAAERQLASTVVSVRERTSAAEATLANAQRSRQYAQEALTRATEDATRANRDLQLSVSGAALSEERAALSLAQARKRLAEANTSDPLELADLNLSVREAEQNLKEVGNRYSDVQVEQAKWARTGVQGSDQVVAATRALEDVQRGVGDAQTGLTRAQVQGAEQIADAQRNVRETVGSVAQANADAADAVGRAQQGVQRAVQQASWSQQDSARGIESAQRALADAYASAAEQAGGGAAAADKAADALAKLSPTGRDFVRFLLDEWKPAWQGTSREISDRLLPGVESGMRSLIGLQPLITAGLSDTGVVIGDLADRGGALMNSGPFRRDFVSIMGANNRMLSDTGTAGLDVISAVTGIYQASTPMLERFTRLAEYSAQAFDSWVAGAQASGDLERNMQSAGDVLMWVGGVLVDVGGDVLTVARNLGPLGYVIVEAIRWTTDLIANLTEFAGPTMTSVVAGTLLGVAVISKLGTAMSGLALAGGVGGIRGFASIVTTLLNPAALNATTAMSGLRDRFAQAGYAAGSAVAANTRWAGAAESGYSAGSRFGNALTKVGSALPVVGAAVIGVGLAYDAMTTSTSEAAEAVMKGGLAAQQARADAAGLTATLDEANAGMPEWSRSLDEWVYTQVAGQATTQSLNAELEKQRAAMSNVERAQSYATEAQGNYEVAVRQFGSTSPEAIQALQQLNDRSRDVEIAQVAVREKTDLATAAMLYQRDQMLGTLDANLRKRQAVQDLARDQQAYADALAQHGPRSAEAEAAAIQLEQTQLRVAEAAKSGKDGMLGFAQSIGDMVSKTKGELSPTLTGMVQSLDWAGLSAAGATLKINEAGQAVAVFPNGKTVVLDANTSLAVGQINFVKGLVDGTRGTIGIDADPGPAVATVGGFKLATDATTGVVTINGNISPADQARLGIQAKTDGTTGTMWIDGNPVPCDGKLNGARISVDRTTGVMSIDANTRPADDASRRAHDTAAAPQTFPLNTDTKPAESSWSRFFGWLGERASSLGSWFVGLINSNAPVPGRAAGGPVGYAGGGLLRGPGTGTSDSILGLSAGGQPTARVSTGEYVVRAAAVRAVGVPALDAINASGYATGGLIGYATGGSVATDPAPAGATSAPGAASTVAAPTGDPAAVAVTVAATDALTGSMTAAAAAAAILNPELVALAATQTGLVAPATDAVTVGQQQLVAAGVMPLVNSLLSTLFPTLGTYQQQVGVASVGANTALQGAQTSTQLSTTATAVNTAVNSASMTASTTGMSLASQGQLAGLRLGQNYTQQSTYAMALNNAAQNNAMVSSTGFMSATNQNHLANLRGAQGITTQSTTAFADSWRAQLGRTMPDSANPIRWVINVPIRSITDAWNTLDAQFALNKHVNPPVAAFASGGSVAGPGTGTSDSIPARLSDGEYVIREKIASRTRPFLDAFNAGQPEAINAAGGFGANPRGVAGKFAAGGPVFASGTGGVWGPGFADGGPVVERINAAKRVAASMNGKPYVWGGASPNGADCSGMVAIVTNALRGETNPFHRIGVARSQPWPGFQPGLNGAWATGYNATHTAGTLAGTNIESGKTPIRYPGAQGADGAAFTGHAFLPQIGGGFVSGGAGGGMIDVGPIVDKAFEKTYREIADVPRFFGPSAQVARDQGVAKAAADAVKGKAMAQLQTMFASMGGGSVESYRGVVGQALTMMGQPAGLADTVLRRMAQESGGNPSIVNRNDINWRNGTPSVGLMQVIGPTYAANKDPRADVGPYLYGVSTNPLSNILASMHYTLGRYGSLPAGYNKAGGYDNGGWLPPGASLAVNHTGRRENKAVFTEDQWKTMQGQAEAARRGGTAASDSDTAALVEELRAMREALESRPGGDVHVHPSADQSEERIGAAARRELDWATKL